MVVTGLGCVTGFSVGLGMINSCGAAGYTRIARAGLGLFKISWGKYLKGTDIFDGFAFYWLSKVVLYGPEVCFVTKTNARQPE